MRKFFKSKYNITIFVIQALALMAFCLSSLTGVMSIIALVLEGIFFIIFGGRYFFDNKKADRNRELYEMMPIEEVDKVKINKKSKFNKKLNVLKGLLFIAFGITIIIIVL